jgi:hypothetical protein
MFGKKTAAGLSAALMLTGLAFVSKAAAADPTQIQYSSGDLLLEFVGELVVLLLPPRFNSLLILDQGGSLGFQRWDPESDHGALHFLHRGQPGPNHYSRSIAH